MADTFRCDMCGGTFPLGSEEEAVAEMRSFFGDIRPGERSVVCDDCFRKIHPADHPHEVETAVAETLRDRKPA